MADFTPLTGKVKHKKFIVLDIESKDGDSQQAGFTRPFMVGVYDGERYYPFFNRDNEGEWEKRYYSKGGCVDLAMRHILKKKYRGYHVYAHNAGKFDYLFLIPWLMEAGIKNGFKFSIMPVASAIQALDIWSGNSKWHKWRFLDSYRLIPIGLHKAAKSFGLEGKQQHDLHLHEKDRRWISYNKQDCVQLYLVLKRFHHYIEHVLMGDVGITAPSTSIKLLRRRYMKSAIPRNEDTHDFARTAYYGGRVEAYEKEGEKLRYYDINSSYPASMLEDMPGGDAVWWEDGEPPPRFKKKRIGFCEVSIHVPENLHIPPLPVRGDGKILPKGKLIFPVGNLRGTWEWDELQMAMEVGCTIEKWHRSVWYERIALFGSFVRDLYQYRDKSREDYDAGLDAVVKLMLNSAYGKFGMKTLRKKIYLFNDPELPECAVPASGEPDSLIWYAEEEIDAAYIMPQISARVTALSRVKLYRYMLEATNKGGCVYYCDTDSVITDTTLETSSELGKLKEEYPGHSGKLYGRFLGPKLYLLSDGPFVEVKAKGFQTRNQEVFERLERGETIQMKRLEKVGTLARENFSRGPRMLTVPRTVREGMGKRKPLIGGSSEPYCVKMW